MKKIIFILWLLVEIIAIFSDGKGTDQETRSIDPLAYSINETFVVEEPYYK